MKKSEQQVARLARRIMFLVAIVTVVAASQISWTSTTVELFLQTAGPIVCVTGALFWFFVIRTREGLFIYAIQELWILVPLWATVTLVGMPGIIFFTPLATQQVPLLTGCCVPAITLATLWFFSIVHNIPICTIRMNN